MRETGDHSAGSWGESLYDINCAFSSTCEILKSSSKKVKKLKARTKTKAKHEQKTKTKTENRKAKKQQKSNKKETEKQKRQTGKRKKKLVLPAIYQRRSDHTRLICQSLPQPNHSFDPNQHALTSQQSITNPIDRARARCIVALSYCTPLHTCITCCTLLYVLHSYARHE